MHFILDSDKLPASEEVRAFTQHRNAAGTGPFVKASLSQTPNTEIRPNASHLGTDVDKQPHLSGSHFNPSLTKCCWNNRKARRVPRFTAEDYIHKYTQNKQGCGRADRIWTR